MTAEELLRDLESMTHAQRVGVMVDLGRQNDAESRALIGELEHGGFYERSLALYSCYGSRDAEHILLAVSDPSRILRGLATRLAALFCDDEQALRGLGIASPPTRLALARKLRRSRRQTVIDAFLVGMALPDDAFQALLPLATEEMAVRHMARFAAHATDGDWRRLARMLPALTFAELERQIANAAPHDGRLLAQINAALQPLTAADPDRALELITSLTSLFRLTSMALASLVERRPSAVADLILSQPERNAQQWRTILWQLRGRARQLSAEQIVGLNRRDRQVFAWNTAWLKAIAPQSRLAMFAAVRPLLLRNGALPADVIATLPAQERAQEARIALARPHLTPQERVGYATYLPWDEAWAAVSPSLHSPDVHLRQAALVALIRAAAYHRARLGDALAELRERRNEQDTVRRAMFAALRALPPGVWTPAHLSDLAELIRHGLNDVGLSSQTLHEIIALLLRLAPSHPEWASAQLAQALRERGWSSPSVTGLALPAAVEAQVASALAPVVEMWAARGDEASTIAAIERLFVRPASFELVAGLIEEIIRRTRERHDAENALDLLATRARARFAALVPALLSDDPSWFTMPIIAERLFRQRQDLLTPFLAYQAYSGRWGTGRQRVLPHPSGCFASGTARQQVMLADAALGVIADQEQDSHVVTAAVQLLALLPAIPAERITPLASDTNPLVRTTALFTLARLDTDAGLAALLDALGDTRARIAVHALRRFLVAMPTEQALDILQAISLDRVTVAKEVVRLIGELTPDAAYDGLLAFERRNLHRDVRIALLRTFGAYLDRPQTWEILQQAAGSPDREIALATLSLSKFATPGLVAEREDAMTQRNLLRLIATLLARPEREVRAPVLQYCGRLGIADTAHTATTILLARVEIATTRTRTRASYDEAFPALTALFGLCAPNDTARIFRLTRALLPHRRLLQAAVDAMLATPRLRERGLEPVVGGMVAALARDPLTARLRMRLVLPHLPAFEIVRLFAGLARTRALRADDLVWACEQFERPALRFSADPLVTMEDAWRKSRDERLRRLAFAVLRARAHTAGEWSDDLMERLRVYRTDRSALVAAAAQFFFPKGDLPEKDDFA